MDRNWSLRTLSIIVLIISAGCSGLGGLMGSGPLSFSAGEISVADSAVSQSGFKVVSDKQISFERSFEVQGQSKKVVMKAHMIHLQRSYQGAPLGTMVIVSLPQIKILGKQIKVAQQINPTDLISRAQGQGGNLERKQKIGEQSVQILGESRTVEIFRGTAKQNGQSARVKIYVTTFSYDGDTIVGVAIIPQMANDEQSPLTLFRGIQEG